MSFADSFWSHDYNLGFKNLFLELNQGIYENEDFVLLFTKRMELELVYGTQLESIQDSKPTNKRIDNDDYVSSVKNAYIKINENFTRQGQFHLEVASNIKLLVLEPFTKWCKEHKQRVEYSESTLNEKYRHFKNGKSNVEKLQKRYFNKCRMLEEFKSHYSEEELTSEMKDLEFADRVALQSSQETASDTEENSQTYQFGNSTFDHKTLKALLTDILTHIELTSHKVPILGVYNNVSSGGAITQWILDNMPEYNGNIMKAETFGQDLINNGFIRLIGSMGNKHFINSSQFFYQWKPAAFEMTKVPQIEASDDTELTESSSLTRANHLTDYFEEMKQAIGVNTIDFNDKTQLSKLINEVNSLDHQYFKSTMDLDKLRCEFEELIMDHLTFMQKCELDRLKAIKKVTFDFLASFGNKITAMKHMCDELVVLEETINPVNDLKFLIENYSTGKFNPHVILYDNYYNSNIKQTFGVSLNVKSRLDRKVVPIIIQCILSHLDNVYPELANDKERVNLWLHPIHLSNVHKLRFQLNELNEPQQINEVLKASHPMAVTNVLKLYFMELPESVVPYNYYDLIKSLYSNYPTGSSDSIDESRINGLQNVLADLPKCSLATLDALLTHLNRLVHIIGSKDEELALSFQKTLAQEFGNIILRPKFDHYSNEQVMNDKHQTSFVKDLFEHKEVIFKELRRRNSSRTDGLSASSSLKSTASQPKREALASKTRLESRLKKAVSKPQPIPPVSQNSDDEGDVVQEHEIKGGIQRTSSTVLPEPPATPPPQSPTKKNRLERSTSPNKRKIDRTNSRVNVVSSKPLKKDIIYNSSDSSPNTSVGDLTQPKFASSLGRKTSVKDLASRFDSPPPTVPAKEYKKKGKSNDDAIVVE